MIRTLHGRLASILLLLLLAVGGLGLAVWSIVTEVHVEEVQQNLNHDLALQIAKAKADLFFDENGDLSGDGLDELFHWLMVVHPGIELYLLDSAGWILAYDPGLGTTERQRVDLDPVHGFLRGEDPPLYGDDPRHARRQKIFSVSPISVSETRVRGYLYIVLASQRYDSVVERLRASHAMRLGLGLLFACFLLAAVVGWWAFRGVTRPLQRLAERMRAWQKQIVVETVDDETSSQVTRLDGIADLEQGFEEVAARVDEQLRAMESGEALRRELIANVSHDLRTPIASLQGYLDTLVLKDGSLTQAERDEYLQIALRQSERLGKLVGELFELTKLENEKVELSLEPFSINELVQDNVQRFQLRAGESGVRLEAEFDPELPFVEADLGRIERVLENLIDNALRFTPEGGIVTLSLSRENERLWVSVRDTGQGIPADALPHIFDRFYRVSQSDRRGGSGLGLAIARRILEVHGSEITVESEPGMGSTFSFHLPCVSRERLTQPIF